MLDYSKLFHQAAMGLIAFFDVNISASC